MNEKEAVLQAIKEMVFEMYALCHDNWEEDELNEEEWNKWLRTIQDTVSDDNKLICEMERYYMNLQNQII